MLLETALESLQLRFGRLMAEYVSHQALVKQRLAKIERRSNPQEANRLEPLLKKEGNYGIALFPRYIILMETLTLLGVITNSVITKRYFIGPTTNKGSEP